MQGFMGVHLGWMGVQQGRIVVHQGIQGYVNVRVFREDLHSVIQGFLGGIEGHVALYMGI